MKALRTSIIVMLLIAAALMAGCKKSIEDYANPNPAQDTPLSENYLSEFESIYELCPNPDGSFFALAAGKNTDYLVKLDNNGYVLQRVELSFLSRRCMVKSGDNIVLIGALGHTSSPFSMYNQGYVVVYDLNMQLVATAILKDSQYKIDINTIIQDAQDPTLFYAGGLAIDGNYLQYPYLCTLRFSEGQMVKLSSKVYSEYAKCRIVGMVEKQSAGQKDLILETVCYSALDAPYDDDGCSVHIVKLNYFDEESGWGHQTWDVGITGSFGDSFTWNNSIDSDDNSVYVFCYADDDKTPGPVDDNHWRSGLIAAVDWHHGSVVWKNLLSLSNRDDMFDDGYCMDGFIYVVGLHSSVMHYFNSGDTKRCGNGLIAKCSISGDLVSYKTFGPSTYTSRLVDVTKDSKGEIVCVGGSYENVEYGELKGSGWFLKTDMSSGGSSKAMSADAKDGWFENLDVESTGVSMDGGMRCGGM